MTVRMKILSLFVVRYYIKKKYQRKTLKLLKGIQKRKEKLLQLQGSIAIIKDLTADCITEL